jgi:type VI secretion system secreted protein VgrG
MTLATGTNLDQIAHRDINQTTGRRWVHNVGESISLFVAGSKSAIKETLKLIAAKGKVQIQAQNDDMEVTADKGLRISSVTKDITAAAKDGIVVTSGGGYARIGRNIDVHCPGTIEIRAANIVLSGPDGMNYAFPSMPHSELEGETVFSHMFDIGSMLHKDPGLEGAAYQIWTKERNPQLLAEGVISRIGRTLRVFTKEPKEVELVVGDNEWVTVHDEQHAGTAHGGEEGTA